jgi:hypothetical protein
MPLSARATGCVDYVLAPDEIPAELDKPRFSISPNFQWKPLAQPFERLMF